MRWYLYIFLLIAVVLLAFSGNILLEFFGSGQGEAETRSLQVNAPNSWAEVLSAYLGIISFGTQMMIWSYQGIKKIRGTKS